MPEADADESWREGQTFLAAWDDHVRRHGLDAGVSPWQMVEQWRHVVQQAESGHTLGWDDFYNDISIRTRIAVALNDPALSPFAAMETFAGQVSSLDDEYRALLLPGAGKPGGSWWDRGILARADPSYAETARHFGATVANSGSRDIAQR
jgi:hypothetical protein